MRTLMNHVNGCISFRDICTLPNGKVCEMFNGAGSERGLFEDDNELDLCLEVAASCTMTPNEGKLFDNILLHSVQINPFALWENIKILCLRTF